MKSRKRVHVIAGIHGPAGERERLVVGLRDGLSPATIAEILGAFARLHKALTNEAPRDPILKVGLPETVGSNLETLTE